MSDAGKLHIENERLKQQIRELRSSSEFFREVIHSSKLYWWKFNLATGMSKFSPELAAIIGQDSINFKKNPAESAISPEDQELIQEKIGLVLAGTTKIYEAEFRMKDKDGRVRWFATRGNITKTDADGIPRIMAGVIFEITEHKKFELSLEKAGKKYRQMLNDEHSAVMLCQLASGKPDKFVEVNNTACQMYNMTRHEFLNTSCHALLSLTIDEDELEKHYKALIKRGNIVLTTDMVNRHGNKDSIEINASLFELDDEKLVLIISRLVSARINAQRALDEIENKYRNLTENLPVIVFRYRLKPRPAFEYINQEAERITGYSADELCTHPDPGFQIIHPEILNRQRSRGNSSVRPLSFTAQWRRKDGLEITVEIRQTPIYDKQGRLIAVEGIATDATERLQMIENAERNLKAERLLSDITARFIRPADIETAIRSSLEDMGIFSNADRVYVFLRNPDNTMSNTNEWCAPGVKPQMNNLQNIPSAKLTWWLEQLNNKEIIMVGDVAAMPPEAASEKQILEVQNIKSLLVLPLYLKGAIAGFIGFDDIRKQRNWQEHEARILRVASGIIESAIEQRQSNMEIRKSEEEFRLLFSKMDNAFALYQAQHSPDGKLADLTITSVNPAFEKLANLPLQKLIGSRLSRLLPLTHKTFMKKFNSLSGKRQTPVFELHIPEMAKYVTVNAYSTKPGMFATLITDVTQRRQINDSLKKSEEKYRGVLNGIPDMIFRMNRKGEFVDAHIQNTQEMLAPPDKFIGRKIVDILPEPLARTTLKKIKETLTDKETNYYEYEMVVNGKTQFFEARMVYLSPSEVLAIVRNVSLRKQAEKEREEYKIFLEQIIAYLPIAVFCKTTSDFKYTLVNQAMEKIIGQSRDEIINQTDYQLFGTEQADKFRMEDVLLAKNGGKVEHEFEFQDKNGNLKIIRKVKIIIELQQNRYIFGLVQDITGQKKFEEELKASETKYRTLIESAGDRIALIDMNENIVFANSTFFTAIGCDPEEYDFHERLKIVFPEQDAPLKNIIHKLKSQKSFSFEYETTHMDGRKLHMLAKSVLLNDSENIPHGILVIIRDITELKQIQQNLIIAKNQAEQADRLKSAFLANMSHEIRTPLNAVTGFANLLSDPALTEGERNEYINAINKNSVQLLSLISDIIDVSKIESGLIEIKQNNVQLNNIIDSAYHTFSRQLTDRRVKLICRKPLPDEKAVINTDRIRLTQIFNNLLNNAIKFTDNGFIEFGYTPPEDRSITFYVKDTGIGIPTEKHGIIFDRFRQVDESTTRKFGGTGLGLSICRNLVNIMGGRLWVESLPGKGATFFFTLPLSDTPALPEEPAFHEHKAYDEEFKWEGKTILIVDDTLISLKFLQALLKKTGITCLTAGSGAEAISKCGSNYKINIVLMDIQMPEMDGLEAAVKIKAIRPELPIIAQTAHALTGDRERILASGCDEYVTKPIDRNELLGKINYFIK